ncbi:MAG: VPLPA-CTERM sorting domain-containing protein [Gammaproteobacteria bacterium]|nr:VPLPA-CTERM sorting domain-containing protein [Gammaproteobacteria bacterium]
MKVLIWLVLMVMASTTTAATVTQLDITTIDGAFRVTIHATGSFNDIWDPNGDGVFGEAGARVNHEPLFFGNYAAGKRATLAVIAALGAEDTWDGESDAVVTPAALIAEGYSTGDGTPVSPGVTAWGDLSPDPSVDPHGSLIIQYSFQPGVAYQPGTVNNRPATAWLSYHPVPLPAAVWLFGSALAGLGLMTRKRNGVEAA